MLNLRNAGTELLTLDASGQLGLGTGGTNTALLDVRGTGLIKTTSATAFQVQNASAVNTFAVDTSAGQIVLGTASSQTGKIQFNTSAGANAITLVGPASNPTGNYTFTIPTITANATICTDNSVCSGYAPGTGGNYIAKDSNDTSTASYVGTLLGLSNTNTGAAGVLSLTNAGTNAALQVTANGNTSASTSTGGAINLNNTSNTEPA